MTNYNERLDKILEKVRYAVYYADYHNNHTQKQINSRIAEHIAEQKQAITSLIKELVAEAKPMTTSVNVIETYLQNGMPQKAAEHHGRNHAIDQYEQNLLKALEEL